MGRMILKHRQVEGLDGIEVVSVPYWEWNELKNSVLQCSTIYAKSWERDSVNI